MVDTFALLSDETSFLTGLSDFLALPTWSAQEALSGVTHPGGRGGSKNHLLTVLSNAKKG
jgi:hypothetical protein